MAAGEEDAGLVSLAREADGRPAGLLLLHHGRGTDERDLIGLADVLDPERRLRVVAPRAPLSLPGSPGYHWYVVPRVGFPDPRTFEVARAALAAFHDALWGADGLDPGRTVLGGFSMGSVMSYAMALSSERPAVAGVLAISGFIPIVEGWRPDFEGRGETRAFVAHGRRDPIIEIGFARQAREVLERGGLEVDYHESDVGHQVDPSQVEAARAWLRSTLD